ncbi:M50 family metallopeptidase [Georgenia sp. 10Sc9-8]|uniref:M50 family metallopeptidase n=1 Tax=Georgenia halotolerans TaxID=3028317 RepID=A0ABT5TUR2_9MICO|nr:M50 family metallopeptidase [Georgenia halotolerans]
MREVTSDGWWAEAWARLQPGTGPVPGAPVVWVVLGVAVAAVVLPPVWWRVRVLVTVVHELGHGTVGVLCGRRFTGLVLRPDMSGHAVTVGSSRGTGLVLTTWAGYPAPAVVGSALVHVALAGWSAPVLGAATVVLMGSLLRVRSVYTGAVMVVAAALTAALWWAGTPAQQGAVVLGLGVFLLLGAWRHLAAVVAPRADSRGSDPAVLARLTHVPAALWNVSFAAVLAVATWLAIGPVVQSLV